MKEFIAIDKDGREYEIHSNNCTIEQGMIVFSSNSIIDYIFPNTTIILTKPNKK